MGMAVRDESHEYAASGKLPREAMRGSSAALQDIGEPVEVAKAAAFLASDDARYITGQAINVCGGRNMD